MPTQDRDLIRWLAAAATLLAVLLVSFFLPRLLRHRAAPEARRETERAATEIALGQVRQLGALAMELSAARTPAHVAEIAFRACRTIGATLASIGWVSPDGREVETLFAFGHDALVRRWARYAVDAPLPNAEAVRGGTPVLATGIAELRVAYPDMEALGEPPGLAAWVSWPLVLRTRAVGVLGLGLDRAGGLPPWDTELLAAVGELTAQALDRAQLHARLEESERRFRLLAENAPDLVYRYRLAAPRGFEYVSPSATALLGYTPEEHYADPDLARKLILPDDLEGVRAAFFTPAGAPLVLRLRRRDGRVIALEQRTVLLRDEAGAPVAVEGIARDITDRVEVQAARERLVEEREDLLRAVSHDFRTPLQAVLLRAESLVRDPNDPERVRRGARGIAESARRMSAAVQDVLHIARLTAGALEPRREPIVLLPFVGEMIRRLFSDEDLARLEVALETDAVVLADPDHLERILTNLLHNALKYSDPPAKVRIASAPDGEARIVSVSDRGSGIPQEDLPRLFERYFRGSRPTGREGTGLGLFVTRMLAEAQGGAVTVESAPGMGSTFRVRLPGA
jgi:PAS domain S-box-containing protein